MEFFRFLWNIRKYMCKNKHSNTDENTVKAKTSLPLTRSGSFEDRTHEISDISDLRSMNLTSAFLCWFVNKRCGWRGDLRSEFHRVHQPSEAHEASQMAATNGGCSYKLWNMGDFICLARHLEARDISVQDTWLLTLWPLESSKTCWWSGSFLIVQTRAELNWDNFRELICWTQVRIWMCGYV